MAGALELVCAIRIKVLRAKNTFVGPLGAKPRALPRPVRWPCPSPLPYGTKRFRVEIVKGTMSVIMRMILDIFGQIFRTLWAHKLRSFLTMFGVAWGVGSLLLLVGLGEGFRSGNKRNLAEFGENIMFIRS